MQPNLLASEHTREALPPTTLRDIFQFDVTFSVSELIERLDRERDEQIDKTEREHRIDLCYCFTERQKTEAREQHAAAVTAIRKAHQDSIASVQRWDAQRLHARHETRDERSEAAAEAARTEAAAEGGRVL